MSYGVSKWENLSGRVPAAAKVKRRARKRKSAASARPAKKRKSAKKKKVTAKKRIAPSRSKRSTTGRKKKKQKKAKAKKPKLYTRYDPITGTSVKVGKDDYRYEEWPSKKQSKKTRKKNLLRDDPLEYARTFGVESVKQDVQRRATATVRRTLSTTAKKLAGGAGIAGLTSGTAAVLTGSLAILAAGYVVMDRVAKSATVALGDRINTISQRFALLQGEIMRRYGVRSWQDVPAEVRNKAVSDYKRAIATASAQAQGSAFVGGRAVGGYK